MGPVLLLIAQLYKIEEQARSFSEEDRLALRQLKSRPILDKLHAYLLEIDALCDARRNQEMPEPTKIVEIFKFLAL